MFVFGKHVENTSYSHMGMDQYLYIPFLGEWTSIYQLFWCSPGVQGFDTLPYIPMVKLLSHEIIGEFRSDGILLCSPAGSPCSVVKRARPIDYPWLSYWHVKHRHVNLLTCETLSELINFCIYFRQVKYKKTAAWNSQNTSHGMMSSHGFRYKQFVDKAKDETRRKTTQFRTDSAGFRLAICTAMVYPMFMLKNRPQQILKRRIPWNFWALRWMVAKSCTKRMVETGWNPINNGINHLSTGAGLRIHSICRWFQDFPSSRWTLRGVFFSVGVVDFPWKFPRIPYFGDP